LVNLFLPIGVVAVDNNLATVVDCSRVVESEAGAGWDQVVEVLQRSVLLDEVLDDHATVVDRCQVEVGTEIGSRNNREGPAIPAP
jgi:hypothetical protein